jgi:hypothetical protein
MVYRTLGSSRGVYFAVEGGDDLRGLGGLAFEDEVAGCFGEGEHLEDEADGEEGLEGDGEAPLDGAGGEAKAVVHPVCDAETDDRDGALQAEQEASVLGGAQLGLVGRDVGAVEAVADARYDPPDQELCECRRRCQDDCSDDHGSATGEDHRLATKTFASEEGEERARGTSNVVDADNSALEFGIWVAEIGGELVLCTDYA